MNDTVFCKSFRFNEFRFYEAAHRDNSRGVDFHFIGFMKHGRGRIVSKDRVIEIEENEMFYIPKGCKYHSYWIADDYVCFDSIGFLYFPTAAPNGYCLQKIEHDSVVLDAFMPLSRDKTVNVTSIGTLYHLLGILESSLEVAPTGRDVAVYEKLLLLIQKNPQLTIPEYAVLCEVSESLLYHYVKRAVGKTPNRLRQEILCKKAAELLSTTNYTVEEICDKLGFSSAAYFRKVFKSVYQKSPSHIRKNRHMI
ncbi:MAG: helix-turn-helix transcriptional regulator [Clostridia bacterium]|nr:helix-turn-helix transcriptional regulator [Clostridia bacterium]